MKTVWLFSILLLPTLTYTQNFWQQTNGPPGGAPRSMAVNQDGYVFAATHSNGLYRSTTSGATWEHIAFRETEVAAVGTKSHYVFAGTPSGIIHRSSDYGITWTSTTINQYVASFAVGPTGIVYAGTANGVFRSTNDGSTWSNIGPTGVSIQSLAIDDSGHVFGTAYVAVYRSTNNGASWTLSDLGLSNPAVTSITISVSGDIYVGRESSTAPVYRSTDNGATWFATNALFFSAQSLVAGRDGSILAGGVMGSPNIGAVLRTTDGGSSWTTIVNTHGFVYSLACDSLQTIFAGAWGGGVYRSTNQGLNWERTGFANSWVPRLIATRAGTLLGSTGSELFRSTDNGDSWGLGSSNLSVEAFGLDSSGNVFSAVFIFILDNPSQPVDIRRSTDDGQTWQFVYWLQHGLSCFATSPRNHVFAGTPFSGVYRSTDAGLNWSQTNEGLTNLFIAALCATPDTMLFAGTANGVFRSSNNGDNWNEVNTGLTYRRITALIVSSPGYLFAGTDTMGIYRSTNGGENWEPVNAGLLNRKILSMVAVSDGSVYAGTDGGGVYCSTSSGESWFSVNSGLSVSRVPSLVFHRDHHLIAGTIGSGVFRSTQPITDVRPAASIPAATYNLSQNYPNPFNPTTEVRFEIPVAGMVSLKVFNLLGQEIATLVSEIKLPSTYTVAWDASGLPSGVYVYRLRAGKSIETRKMLLLR